MSKYDALSQHLRDLEIDQWNATFLEIEAILGFKLPDSAREYPAWWANQKTGPRVQCRSWMNEGWETTDLNLAGEMISFQRVKSRLEETASTPDQEGASQSLSEVIQVAKSQIASRAGVSVDNVKILIDY